MERNIRQNISWRHLGDPSRPPLLLTFRSSNAFIVAVCCIAAFTDLFLYSIIVPILPFTLTTRAGVPAQDRELSIPISSLRGLGVTLIHVPVQYWTSALIGCYAGGMLVASPICGWLIDRCSSRRLPFVLGLLTLGGSTVLLCVGTSVGVLVLGRLVEGLSTALILSCAPALLVDTVGQEGIGKALGYFQLCSNLAVLTGPVISGAVFARSGYVAVFAMAFALIGLDTVLRLMLIEKKVAAKWIGVSTKRSAHVTPSSTWSSLLETAEIKSPANASENSHEGSTNTTVLSPSNHNFPPFITLLRSRRLLTALWGSLAQATILCAFDAVLPLFVHRTFGWDSTGAGLIFLAICIPSFAAPLVGRLADQYGPRWFVAVGFTTSLPCLVLLRLVTHHSMPQIVLLCVLLFMLGMSFTLIMGPLVAEIAYLVKEKEDKMPGIFGKRGAFAQAFGLYYCWFAAGLLIGPIWAGYAEQAAGWGTMTWTLGLLGGVTAIPTLAFTGAKIQK